MADNVPITAGSGTNIATDDVASVHFQRVKLVDGTLDSTTAIAGDATGALFVGGAIAHDGVDSGNPLKLGGKAIAHGANPSAVAAADRTDLYANRAGILFVIGGHPNILTLRATSTSAQTDVALITVGAGVKIVVTQIQVTLSVATTATPSVIIGFGTASTPTTTGVVISHPGLPGGGGVSRGDGSGIIGIGADDADLRITNTVPTGGTLDVVISYYTIES